MATFSANNSYFETVTNVNDTWAKVKALPNYKEAFGVALFREMFKIAPDAWSVFPWGSDTASEEIFKNKQFLMFAKKFVGMLDMAIDMLGPDMEIVEEQLGDIGIMHLNVGVMPQHYPLMGVALVETMEQKLGEKVFTQKHKDAWGAVFSFMSTTMMQSAFVELKKQVAASKKAMPSRSTSREGSPKSPLGMMV